VTLDQLVTYAAIWEGARILQISAESLNVLIYGGTGSGQTTCSLLTNLSSMTSEVITCEAAPN